jgi:hypothetical protein
MEVRIVKRKSIHIGTAARTAAAMPAPGSGRNMPSLKEMTAVRASVELATRVGHAQSFQI